MSTFAREIFLAPREAECTGSSPGTTPLDNENGKTIHTAGPGGSVIVVLKFRSVPARSLLTLSKN
jgi:hypothetical protein